ncbi:ATP-binding protein [Bradyrhizobium macuxiense]|nr:ATP-binding protein [Bradyrhizobium macuxiense]
MCSADLLFAVRPSFRGHFTYEGINPAFESQLGVSSEDVRDADIYDCMSGDDARSVCKALRAGLAEGTEVRVRQRLTLGGSPRTMETTVTPIVDRAIGGVVRLIGSHRDVRNDPFGNAARCADGLNTSVGLSSIQDGIQQRIASDLHDSTCQHLIAASLGLMRVRSNLGDAASAQRLCDDIDASIDEAIREIRAFAYLLHPRNLAGEGLKATIERYSQGFSARTSLRVTVNIVPDVDRLPYETKRTLLRVVQEALTNVFRHAKATEVAIAIGMTDGHFRLTVSDNGRGLPPNPGRRSGSAVSIGVGILAMRARLREIGGSLDIQSNRMAPHSGTILCAVFPHALTASRRNRRRTANIVKARRGTQSAKEH